MCIAVPYGIIPLETYDYDLISARLMDAGLADLKKIKDIINKELYVSFSSTK